MIDPTKETQVEFENEYDDNRVRCLQPSGVFQIQPGESKPRMISMPCTCEDGGGPTHWAAIGNTTEAIESHVDHEDTLKWLRENGG